MVMRDGGRYRVDFGEGHVFRKVVFPQDRDILIQIHKVYDTEYGFPHEEGMYFELAGYLADHIDIYHPMIWTIGGAPAGYIRAYDRLSTSSCGIVLMVDLVYILPEFRGAGLGTRMMSAFMNFAEQSGAARIDLLTDLDNPAAVKLYEKFGFKGRHRFQMIRFLKTQPALETYLEAKRATDSRGRR